MANNEEMGSPGWSASFFMQTTEDMARAVAAAATAVRTPRPSVVFSTKSENGSSQMQKLRHNFSKLLKGFSNSSEVKNGLYNPEVLTSQKRQWANFQLQHLENRPLKEPTKLFESMVVVGLHPNCDLLGHGSKHAVRNFEGPGKSRNAFIGWQHQSRVEPGLEPQVLFVYPPDKQLPLKCKDLLSFCFPEGVEVKAVERTSSMSELNEILLGQEHFKQIDQSFVFRLQVADDSTLYGCCVLVEEMLHNPSSLISMITEKQPLSSPLSRHILTTRRCYCILSRLPFFELHFGVLNSIFTEEKLERLTRSLGHFDVESSEDNTEGKCIEEQPDTIISNHKDADEMLDEAIEVQDSISKDSSTESSKHNNDEDQQSSNRDLLFSKKSGIDNVVFIDRDVEMGERESVVTYAEGSVYIDNFVIKKQSGERRVPDAVPPLLRHNHYESSESSSSFQGSPSEDGNFRSDGDDTETEEASCSGQEDPSDYSDILKWAKENSHGSLEIICEYYQLRCPPRGSTIRFHPLEHLYPLEYHRPDETVLHTAGSTIDLRSCSTSLELAEAHSALVAEEEAIALSVWAVACICGSLHLDNMLTVLAGALLEKQIVFVCSNLGILSGSVLSIVPLIRPYQWQSLLMPVLPNDMLDFLDAPVPYIVGIKNKTNEVYSKLTNAIFVDLNRNQVKSQTVPKLPKQKQLYSSLSQYHMKLFAESNLGRKRPVYECTDVQIEAAKGLLSVLRLYLDSLCSNLRAHTITNVQSNDDKVSLLLKESFIDSFPTRDRPFMKQFVETQLFSVHTDLVLSFFEKE